MAYVQLSYVNDGPEEVLDYAWKGSDGTVKGTGSLGLHTPTSSVVLDTVEGDTVTVVVNPYVPA